MLSIEEAWRAVMEQADWGEDEYLPELPRLRALALAVLEEVKSVALREAKPEVRLYDARWTNGALRDIRARIKALGKEGP